ncbi:carbonic anhydrase [Oceanococcus atlanticus]|uniref:carbonic anhydrase n=1 Tax=Oceanococcus atlanticus TaxID=1317117 RepID=A0A1Y1SB59_9GAMM|nr:carbonic anhydrase [Oceanococcus atlanticus]ORE85271.1 carbonic anhydrase [Oceanococcus atlanticus]RZO84015.1 MAG: carbonic anhydrase [Oceanococcus sp.]
MPAITEALNRLREGNRRFVERLLKLPDRLPSELSSGQSPFAVILGCSDSRVPAELVFDQGLGDLFVIRVAGNIVAPTQIGSVEFAATQFGTPLVVVLGHGSCGAVTATLSEMTTPTDGASRNLRSIVSRIEPALKPLMERGAWDDQDKLMGAAVRANVRASVQQLKAGSQILEGLINERKLMIVGAEYNMQSGEVTFLDLPEELA